MGDSMSEHYDTAEEAEKARAKIDRFERMRKTLGWTYDQTAERLDMEPRAIRRYAGGPETAQHRPMGARIMRLMRAYVALKLAGRLDECLWEIDAEGTRGRK